MSISKAVLSGRVIRPPEKRFTPNTNVAVTEFSIAVESQPRQDGSVETHPVKVIAWRDLAERLANELQKGDLVAVDGRLQINSYTSSDGQRRRDVEIDATAVENLTATLSGEPPQARAVVKAGARPKPTEKAVDDLDAIFAAEDEVPF